MHRYNSLNLGLASTFSKIELTSLGSIITSFITEGQLQNRVCFSQLEIRSSTDFRDVCNSSRAFPTCVATLSKRFCLK